MIVSPRRSREPALDPSSAPTVTSPDCQLSEAAMTPTTNAIRATGGSGPVETATAEK